MAKWGCGTNCVKFVIVDSASGTVYDPNVTVGCSDTNGSAADIQFRLTSRLLMANGITEHTGCGTRYYVWDGERLRAAKAQSEETTITPQEECLGCPKIVVRGRLAQLLSILECNGNSGMTCHIQFKGGSKLPSRVAVQQLDANGKVIGKFLPCPDLKPGEKGWATFPFGSAQTVVLLGEWNGPYRDQY